jgi:hypothetical protein
MAATNTANTANTTTTAAEVSPSPAASDAIQASELTINDALVQCFKKKTRPIKQLTTFLAHFAFAPEMTVSSVFRWIVASPNDLRERPSSRHIGTWQDKRMLETLQMLTSLVKHETVKALVDSKEITDTDYTFAVDAIGNMLTEFEALVEAAERKSESNNTTEEEAAEAAPNVAEKPAVIDLNAVAESLARIRTTMLAFHKEYKNEPFFEVCTHLVMSEVDGALQTIFSP